METNSILQFPNKVVTRFVLLLICVSLLLPVQVWATDMTNPDFFLKMGIGARPFGMGGAFTAVADDANSTYYNPAGLADLKFWEFFSVKSDSYDFDISYDYTNLVVPMLPGKVVGVSYAQLKTDDIPITSSNNPSILDYVSDKETAIILSYGHRLSDYFSLGVNVKRIDQNVYIGKASGTEADFSMLYTPSRTVRFGINFQDLLPGAIVWNTGSSVKIPMTIRTGVAFHIHDWGTIIAFDANKVDGRDYQFNGGFEYQFNEAFQGRLGYNDGDPTMGFSYIRDSWRLDYGYKKSELGDTNRVAMGFRFGTFMLERLFSRPKTPKCGGQVLKSSCATGEKSGKVSLQSAGKLATGGQAAMAQQALHAAQDSDAGNTAADQTCSPGQVNITAQPNINEVLERDDGVVRKSSRGVSASFGKREDLLKKGNTQLLEGKYDAAANTFQNLVRTAPDYEQGHLKLAGIYHYQKRYHDAIEEYKDAIASNPSNMDNYINIATLYAKLKEFDHAAEAVSIVSQLAPDSPRGKMAEKMYRTFTGNNPDYAATSGLSLEPVRLGENEIVFENDQVDEGRHYSSLPAPTREVQESPRRRISELVNYKQK
jgi:tetratricopeptide (TPR) repeat protein